MKPNYFLRMLLQYCEGFAEKQNVVGWVGTGLFVTGLAMGVASAASIEAREQIFTDDEIAFLKKINQCNSCKYFHGVNYGGVDLICAFIHIGLMGVVAPIGKATKIEVNSPEVDASVTQTDWW